MHMNRYLEVVPQPPILFRPMHRKHDAAGLVGGHRDIRKRPNPSQRMRIQLHLRAHWFVVYTTENRAASTIRSVPPCITADIRSAQLEDPQVAPEWMLTAIQHVAFMHHRNPIEYFVVRNRSQQLQILRMRPH